MYLCEYLELLAHLNLELRPSLLHIWIHYGCVVTSGILRKIAALLLDKIHGLFKILE